ncbi:hypothetical protein F4860DRAFT_111165 [Xylaria cubensis]|nr:hypothetical protein F4860DRAFT_111165 [Xylaria cubensis]
MACPLWPLWLALWLPYIRKSQLYTHLIFSNTSTSCLHIHHYYYVRLHHFKPPNQSHTPLPRLLEATKQLTNRKDLRAYSAPCTYPRPGYACARVIAKPLKGNR